MLDRYEPRSIESDAQKFWDAKHSFRVTEDPARQKFYCLSMFPYPSGKLHMGHVRNYTIGDVLTRHYRMRGMNVLQPMGWDAFGLPAENAAMANKVPPAKWTRDNIAYMKKQLQGLGFALDWERELATCDPTYYKWNQWLFTRLFRKGLAYKKTGIVNWDPVDQTVLANEQVIDGRGWRTGAPVEKREIPMYFFRITHYAEELLGALQDLSGWPEQVKLMQKNWIGRSEGVKIGFPYKLENQDHVLWVFTTRADTLMGTTFCAVAAEHPIALHAGKANKRTCRFHRGMQARHRGRGGARAGSKRRACHRRVRFAPISGEKIPVWVGNYVLMTYGEGAVMGVPAHDERDFEFALKYGLPIPQVIQVGDAKFDDRKWYAWYDEKGPGQCVNSGKYDGLGFQAAVDAVAADLKAKNLGEKQVQWRLRDWGLSRQRYWGCPVPIIPPARPAATCRFRTSSCRCCCPRTWCPDGTGNPLAKLPAFYETTCPSCGKPAKRETDTMDTFVDSSWYFARYACPDFTDGMVDGRARYWMAVDQYIGGIEHAILHLLLLALRHARHARRGTAARRLRALHQPADAGHGARRDLLPRHARGPARMGASVGRPSRARRQGQIPFAQKPDGTPVVFDGIGTMSKSRNNGVDPQLLIEKYGADTARFFIIFASPPTSTLEWSDEGVDGSYRFLKRLWNYGLNFFGRQTGSGKQGHPPRDPRGAEAGQLRPRQAPVQYRGLRGDEDAEPRWRSLRA